VLALIRKAALWVFSVLYDVADAEQRLAKAILNAAPSAPPQHHDEYDRAIDREYGMVDLGDQSYYVSEVLFAVDYAAYRDTGGRLCSGKKDEDPENDK